MHILHCNMKIKTISNRTKKLFGVAETLTLNESNYFWDGAFEVLFDFVYSVYLLDKLIQKYQKLSQSIGSLNWTNSINRITDHNFSDLMTNFFGIFCKWSNLKANQFSVFMLFLKGKKKSGRKVLLPPMQKVPECKIWICKSRFDGLVIMVGILN